MLVYHRHFTLSGRRSAARRGILAQFRRLVAIVPSHHARRCAVMVAAELHSPMQIDDALVVVTAVTAAGALLDVEHIVGSFAFVIVDDGGAVDSCSALPALATAAADTRFADRSSRPS